MVPAGAPKVSLSKTSKRVALSSTEEIFYCHDMTKGAKEAVSSPRCRKIAFGKRVDGGE